MVRLCSDPVFDLEGAHELEVKLLVQSLCFKVAARKPYHVPNIEHLRFCFPVCVDGLGAPRVDPLHFDISTHCDHSFSPFLGGWDVGIHLFDEPLLDRQVCTLKCVEWRAAQGRVEAIVVGELGHWQPGTPVVLLVHHIGSEVLLQCLVLALHLPISLWVEHHTQLPFDPEEVAQRQPKLGCKDCTTVRDDSLRCASTLKDPLAVEQVRKSGSIDVLLGLVVARHLCIPINNNENGFVCVSMSGIQWQVCDEVHGDLHKDTLRQRE